MSIIFFIWQLPITILTWVFYILPFWALGYIQYRTIESHGVVRFALTKKRNWYTKLWKDWWGWSGPYVIILRNNHKSPIQFQRAVTHELTHCEQMRQWGFIFPFLYLGASLYIYIARKELHSYFDNPFEIEARRTAGQKIKIDKKYWGYGTDSQDRWSWW